MLPTLKRVLDIINTISKTVTVASITTAAGMTEGGVTIAAGMTEGGGTIIMNKEGGTEIGDLTTTVIDIIRLGIRTGLTMIDHITMGRIIVAPPGGECLIANNK